MPSSVLASSVFGIQSDSAGSFEMGWPLARDTRSLAQQLADIREDLEIRHWRVVYPTHRRLVGVVDEAARRAQSTACLEDALRRLH